MEKHVKAEFDAVVGKLYSSEAKKMTRVQQDALRKALIVLSPEDALEVFVSRRRFAGHSSDMRGLGILARQPSVKSGKKSVKIDVQIRRNACMELGMRHETETLVPVNDGPAHPATLPTSHVITPSTMRAIALKEEERRQHRLNWRGC